MIIDILARVGGMLFLLVGALYVSRIAFRLDWMVPDHESDVTKDKRDIRDAAQVLGVFAATFWLGILVFGIWGLWLLAMADKRPTDAAGQVAKGRDDLVIDAGEPAKDGGTEEQ
jgi:hypothetical protein